MVIPLPYAGDGAAVMGGLLIGASPGHCGETSGDHDVLRLLILFAHPCRHQERSGAKLGSLQSSTGKAKGHGILRGISLNPTGERERPRRIAHPLSYQLAAGLDSQAVLRLL